MRYSYAVDLTNPESTLTGHQYALLGGERTLTLIDLANKAGVSVTQAQQFWRSMGFADIPPDRPAFTDADVHALKNVSNLVTSHAVDEDTSSELLRALSFTMDRLVLWQLEALVSDVSRRLSLDDTSARLVVLDHMSEMVPALTEQLTYAWKRHMAALLGRTDSEVAQRGPEEAGPDYYPLTRALGFVDIVSFTQKAQRMGKKDLTNLLQDFENTARNVVTSRGARVVKTIGDAVMYIADDLTTAADVVTALVDELQRGPEMILVRASLVYGRVVSRSGDVFGPTVNLASRLVDTAPPGGIRMDESTARAIERSDLSERYDVERCHEVVTKGLGTIVPWALTAKSE
ncbi:adenylate/guanylate cyclase domain-containing protein [Actinomyces vulturis]|uniref:adenylate/guanylate cyclase domain-containing protein n=1 Tax=Actinomyces vulturis TaxID=1857645 RepID=UPI00082DEA8F|nr:adenylate/guanylate cyclase domain-containing protein [Actinomyces vulturis]